MSPESGGHLGLTGILRRVGAVLAPDDVDPDTMAIVRSLDEQPSTPAFVAAGRRVADRHPSVRAAAHRESFVCFPRTQSPRALLPRPITRPSRDLLRPRSAASGWKGSAHRAVSRLPSAALSTASTPVTYALPRESGLIAEIRANVAGAAIGFYLGNRFNYRRPALFAFGCEGLEAVCKFVGDEFGRVRLDVERQTIEALARDARFDGRVPRVILARSTAGGDALLMTALRGEPTAAAMTPAVREWLALCCGDGGNVPVTEFSHVAEEVSDASSAGEPIARVVAAAREILAGVSVPLTVVHGDVAPWNTLMEVGTLRVFDWEYAVVEGVPGWDEAFWHVQVGLVMHHWDVPDLMATLAALPPPHAYRPTQHRALLAFLVAHLRRRALRTGDAARCALLERTAVAMLDAGWLTRDR